LARSEPGRVDLSVVIPSYNGAEWLPSTLEALAVAVDRSGWTAEVIVIDDGSTDSTRDVLAALAPSFPVELIAVHQENRGRFLARWEGIQRASGRYTLLIDSRVLIGADSLAYVARGVAADPSAVAWNAHTDTDPCAPLVGRFWEVPTYVFWGAYLGDPRPTRIEPQNFDRVPKGTTCFLLETALFEEACRAVWPEGDPRLTSDDTKLLRYIAGRTPIVLDPGFQAVYRPRTSVRAFLDHSRTRGTLFVDSYAGTSATRDLVLLGLALSVPVALGVIAAAAAARLWWLVVGVPIVAVLVIIAPALLAGARRCPPRAVAGYLLYIIPFGAVFWLGLVRGIVVHRRSFRTRRQSTEKV